MVAGIIAIAEKLFSYRNHLRAADFDARARIATWLISVSECVAGCVVEFRAGVVPHGRCAELGVYAMQAPEILVPVLGEPEGTAIAQELDAAHEIEGLWAELGQQNMESEDRLVDLDKAAGILRAVANTVRAR